MLTQTHGNWECIVVDDGSVDDTKEVLAGFTSTDKRFIYVYKENGGPSSARNLGLEYVTGDFIQFLDSDDLLQPVKFQEQIRALRGRKDFVAICDYLPFVNDEQKTFNPDRYRSPFLDNLCYKEEIISDWEHRISVPIHCFLTPSCIVKDNNLRFNEKLTNHEDWAFWCKVLFYTNGIIFQHERFAEYRIHRDSICHVDRMELGFINAARDLIIKP